MLVHLRDKHDFFPSDFIIRHDSKHLSVLELRLGFSEEEAEELSSGGQQRTTGEPEAASRASAAAKELENGAEAAAGESSSNPPSRRDFSRFHSATLCGMASRILANTVLQLSRRKQQPLKRLKPSVLALKS